MVRAVGAGGAGGRAGGSNKTLFSSLLTSEYGSMWAVGAVGVLEERKACGRWCGGNSGEGADGPWWAVSRRSAGGGVKGGGRWGR